MNSKTLFPLFFLGLFLAGCGEKQLPVSENTIDLRKALSRQVSLKASEYFSQVEYIPLEITDEATVGDGPDVQFIGDRLLITTSHNQAFLFDRHTGKLIREVGHYGEDPEAYSNSYGWVNHANGLIYFSGWGENLVTYTQEGEFNGEVKVPLGDTSGNIMMSYTYLSGDTLAGYYNDMFGDSKERLILFDGDAYRNILPVTGYQPVIDMSELSRIDINGGEVAAKIYGPAANKGVLRLETQEDEIGGFVFMGNIFFWHQGEATYFKEPFNDTIYTVSAGGIAPRQVLELGEYKWNIVDKLDKTKEKAPYFTQIIENENYMIMQYIRQIYTDPQVYNLIYNKADRTAKSDKYVNGFVDDITHFLPLQPLYVSPSGEFAGLLTPDAIHTWFEDNKDSMAKLPEAVRNLRDIPFDANPVVVIFR